MSSPSQSSKPRKSSRLAAAERRPPAARREEHDAAILARRAMELARPLPELGSLPAGEVVVVATVGGQRLGFPSRYVQEAVAVAEITLLPGLPARVLGLANVRRRVLPVFTLAPVLRLTPATDAPGNLLLLTWERGEFAVAIDHLEGIRAIEAGSLQRTISGATEALLQGVTPDGILLIDVGALATELAVSDDGSVSSSFNSP